MPVSAFLSINLSDKVIHDRNQVRTIVQQRPPETVSIQNNIVINNVIQVSDIEKATNKKVKVLEEKHVNNPDAAGKTDTNSVAIFNPIVADSTDAKPKNPKKVEEIVVERKAKGIQPVDVPPDQVTAPAPTLDKNGKPIAPVTIAPPVADTKAKTDVPVVKPDKPVVDAPKPADPVTPKVDAPAKVEVAPQPAVKVPVPPVAPVVVAPVAKPKIEKVVKTPPAPALEPPKKKVAEPAAPVVVAPPAAPKAPAADGKTKIVVPPPEKTGKGAVVCDPNVETCPPVK